MNKLLVLFLLVALVFITSCDEESKKSDKKGDEVSANENADKFDYFRDHSIGYLPAFSNSLYYDFTYEKSPFYGITQISEYTVNDYKASKEVREYDANGLMISETNFEGYKSDGDDLEETEEGSTRVVDGSNAIFKQKSSDGDLYFDFEYSETYNADWLLIKSTEENNTYNNSAGDTLKPCVTYTYQGMNLVKKVETDNYETEETEYVYEGSLPKKIITTVDGNLDSTVDFTITDGKVVSQLCTKEGGYYEDTIPWEIKYTYNDKGLVKEAILDYDQDLFLVDDDVKEEYVWENDVIIEKVVYERGSDTVDWVLTESCKYVYKNGLLEKAERSVIYSSEETKTSIEYSYKK